MYCHPAAALASKIGSSERKRPAHESEIETAGQERVHDCRLGGGIARNGIDGDLLGGWDAGRAQLTVGYQMSCSARISHRRRPCVTMTPAVFPRCFHQAFNLALGEILAPAQLGIGWPPGGDCSVYGGWRDQFKMRLGHDSALPALLNWSKGFFSEQFSKA
jgi:hypothetical protein